MESGPKMLIFAGAVLVAAGVIWQFGGNFLHLGRLPGDIRIERENVRFYFPVVSSIVISIVLTLLFNLFRHFNK